MEAMGGRTVVAFEASPAATAIMGASAWVVMSVVVVVVVVVVDPGLSGLTSKKLCSNGLGSISSFEFACV